MANIGTVESLWRYPVKSMRGEELDEIYAGLSGVRGDRVFAFRSSAARADFPYFTAREQHEMLKYRPRFRQPLNSGALEPSVDVETPTGERLAIDDPALTERLRHRIDEKHHLSLMRSERALTDCHPISLFSLQTVAKLSEETGLSCDKRRFRANIYLDLASSGGFAEDEFVGRSIRIGSEVVISLLERDPRCMMITLDPDTASAAPALLKKVAQEHGGTAGVYGTVLVEGFARKGDAVELLDS
ncbi:MAG: MOSC domain-containing protein [Chthoniobacterales bacterium]|nr:MOSC domain-containing protein [Chthoniobacterales bacterium]